MKHLPLWIAFIVACYLITLVGAYRIGYQFRGIDEAIINAAHRVECVQRPPLFVRSFSSVDWSADHVR